MNLQAREKKVLIGGSVVVVLLLLYLLWPSGQRSGSQVELVSAEQRQGSGATPSPAPVAPPAAQAPPPVQPAAVAPQPTAPASPIPEGMKLTGVVGGGAIFSFPDGSQRLVQRGRDIAPGVILQSVSLREVVLAVGPTNYRMGFGGSPVPFQPDAPVAAAAPVQPGAPQPPAVAQPGAPAAPVMVAPAPVPNANLAR